jgi:hypothetical protein
LEKRRCIDSSESHGSRYPSDIKLEIEYFLDRALTDKIIYGRGGLPLEFGDVTEMTFKAFGKNRDFTSRSASAGTDDGDGEVINLPPGGS